jgi:hypothetical protein
MTTPNKRFAAAIARAVKLGDVEAERAARAELASEFLWQYLARLRANDIILSTEQATEIHGMLDAVTADEITDEERSSSGPVEIARHVIAANDECSDRTCDRCGQPGALVRGMVNPTQSPTMVVEMICPTCRELNPWEGPNDAWSE